MILIVLLLITSALLYIKFFKPLNYWKIRGIPHKKPLPFVGNNLKEALGRLSFIDGFKLAHEDFPNLRYNGYFQFMVPVLIVRDLDLIKQITVKDFDHFVDHMTNITTESDTILNNTLFLLRGQKWKDIRATLSPAFTSSKLRGMYHLIYEIGEQFVDYFQNNHKESENVEIKDAFARFANDVIATTAFGIKCDSLGYKNNEFYTMGNKLTDISGLQAVKFFLTSTIPKLVDLFKISILPKKPAEFLINVIKTTIRNREQNGIVRPDLIHLLLEARKGKLQQEECTDPSAGFATVTNTNLEKGKSGKVIQLTDDEIAAQSILFFFAGFDTVSSALSFVAYELALNPDIQERLSQEVDEAMEKGNGKISYDDLLKMEYLDMVVSETLRKWPAGVIIDRKCVKTLTIEPKGDEKQPLVIEKDWNIIISMFGVHRDPKYYPHPDKFDPERFNQENRKNIHPYAYFPFGLGPRACIGSRFALLEMKILTALLLSKFQFTVIDKTPIPFEFELRSLNMKGKKGMWLGMKPRSFL